MWGTRWGLNGRWAGANLAIAQRAVRPELGPAKLFQLTLRQSLLAQSLAQKLSEQPLASLHHHHESQLDSGPYGHWHGCLDCLLIVTFSGSAGYYTFQPALRELQTEKTGPQTLPSQDQKIAPTPTPSSDKDSSKPVTQPSEAKAPEVQKS
ncbi:hypothetical protein AAWM_01717 [Aspergillus awamori]|uniref:Uncharacterized protein n=1 Tax=Aspergillus awamori TaxID=105351 RepID=A0A401KI28_ASPAW|nr:hypothetical protein AAWM_01717 [Aspergillus awamori]